MHALINELNSETESESEASVHGTDTESISSLDSSSLTENEG